ncbi:hypothetical protein MRX96_027829 [Rhipicephalus microplus]
MPVHGSVPAAQTHALGREANLAYGPKPTPDRAPCELLANADGKLQAERRIVLRKGVGDTTCVRAANSVAECAGVDG